MRSYINVKCIYAVEQFMELFIIHCTMMYVEIMFHSIDKVCYFSAEHTVNVNTTTETAARARC